MNVFCLFFKREEGGGRRRGGKRGRGCRGVERRKTNIIRIFHPNDTKTNDCQQTMVPLNHHHTNILFPTQHNTFNLFLMSVQFLVHITPYSVLPQEKTYFLSSKYFFFGKKLQKTPQKKSFYKIGKKKKLLSFFVKQKKKRKKKNEKIEKFLIITIVE